MEKKLDLRTKKIYVALIKTFEELLEEKSFEEITINELCDRAQTRRATFYKHFSDKYDFFQFMLKELRNEMIEEIQHSIEVQTPENYLHTLIDVGLLFTERNKKLLLSIDNNSVAGGMLQTITDQMYDENRFQFLLNDEVSVQFLIGALNQCGRWWIAHYSKISREEMQKKLYKIADACMDTLRNC